MIPVETPLSFLIIVNWTLWSVLFVALVYALFTFLADRDSKSSALFGVCLVSFGLLFSTGSAVLLYWFGQEQSFTGLVVMMLLLAWPLVPLVGRPALAAAKSWKESHVKTSSEPLSA